MNNGFCEGRLTRLEVNEQWPAKLEKCGTTVMG